MVELPARLRERRSSPTRRRFRSRSLMLRLLAHHERIGRRAAIRDRVAGDDIPILSRIIAVADTFDVMTARETPTGVPSPPPRQSSQSCVGSPERSSMAA